MGTGVVEGGLELTVFEPAPEPEPVPEPDPEEPEPDPDPEEPEPDPDPEEPEPDPDPEIYQKFLSQSSTWQFFMIQWPNPTEMF